MSGTTMTFAISTEAQLIAAIGAINAGGTDAAAGANYSFLIIANFALSGTIPPIDLLPGDSLSIIGDALNADTGATVATISGGNRYQGFVVNSGTVALSNLDLSTLSAAGGTGGAPSGGGALFVGAGASVITTNVNFSGDRATGGTPAGGAVFVAQGGTFEAIGGTIGASGTAAGTGLFIQGNNTITIDAAAASGTISDQTGAHLGTGSGTVNTIGAVTLSATNAYTGGTIIDGTLTLAAPGAAGAGAITFGVNTGAALVIGAGDTTSNVIAGFLPNSGVGAPASDTIDVQGIGLATSYTLSASNQLTLIGGSIPVTLNLDPTANYSADTFVLTADGASAAGTAISVVQSTYFVGTEAALNAALAQIDLGGQQSRPSTNYSIVLTNGFTLTSDLSAINLAAGDTLTIDGAGATIDGGNSYRGFLDFAGGLILENLTIQNAVATGGAGGQGATPGGGGAGLGGGLFVGAAGAASLSNVIFLNDSAVGGAAGAAGGVGIGGGGGMGGTGGSGASGHYPIDGGGGGLGLTATGGNGGSIAVGPGIVPSGASFIGGGGAGGWILVTVTRGSGRGAVSHTYYTLEPAAVGGLPGFGGGAASGAAAGFGGGGANSAGGFGGGGSGLNAGGFGGGAGTAAGAGGGLGAGGGIFVQQGGSLTFLAGAISGGTVAGGQSSTGGAGLGLGDGIFIQGTNGLSFAPTLGQTLSVADVIADQAGAGGSGTVAMNGAGTVVLSAANSFSGGLILNGGTLSLQAAGAAGTGLITFGYDRPVTLIVGAGDVPSNVLSGFLPGDVIDLQGIGVATSVTPDASDPHVLDISGGTTAVQLNLDPAQNLTGESFVVASDGGGGTFLTAIDVGDDLPPFFAGTGTVAGDDHTPFNPFAAVTLADAISGAVVTATITQSAPGNGTLSNLGGGTYDPLTGVYTITGDAVSVSDTIAGLVFTPTINQVAPGQTETTGFALSATDGVMTSIARTQTVNITALNDAPVITSGGFVEGEWNAPFAPLAGLTVTDPDAGAMETATITLADSGGYGGTLLADGNGTLSLSMPGITLTHPASDTYTLTSATPALLTAALDAIQFNAIPHPALPGYTITYITTTVSDGIAPPVVRSTEVLTGLPIFNGLNLAQSATAGQAMTPFSGASITDSAGLTIQGLTIVVFDSSGNYTTPTDANGFLSGANLTRVGVGTYSLTPGSTADVSAALQGLTFTPTPSNTAATTDFVLEAFDGATTSDSNAIAVTAQPGAPLPTILGTIPGQAILDSATVDPFALVTVTDANPTPLDSATITLTDGISGLATDANGVLSGAGLIQIGAGVYTLAATDPATLSAELNGLIFTPTLNEVAPGYQVFTNLALTATDANGSVTDMVTSVTVTPSAVDPVISGTVYGQLVADGSAINPFSGVTVTDANPSPTDTALIVVNDINPMLGAVPSDADGTLLLSSTISGTTLTEVSTGTYVLSATDPASLTTALRALVFDTTLGDVTSGQTLTTGFTLTVQDNAAFATDQNTSVITTYGPPPAITIDPVAGTNAINAAAAEAGFTITGTTTNVEDGQTVWVELYNSALGYYADVTSAIVTGGTWSADVPEAQALALGDGTLTVYAYTSNAAGLTTPAVAEDLVVNLAGVVAATPGIVPTALAFGSTRVGAPAVTLTTTISNGTSVTADQASLAYGLGALPSLLASDLTASGTIASGGASLVDLIMQTNTAGAFTNVFVPISFVSLAPGGSGLTDTSLSGGAVTVSGTVYATAVAQVAPTLNFGVVHVGSSITKALAISNAATGAVSDVLTGGLGAITGPFTGAGSLGTGIAAGASGSLNVMLLATTSGVVSGSASLNLASHDSSLADIALSVAPIVLTGTIDNYAVAALEKVSGAGTLSRVGNAYTLNLGSVAQGTTRLTVNLGAVNAASGLADLLSGSFSVTGSGAFTNTGLTAFSGLGAGQADIAPSVTLSTTNAGTFSETITLNSVGANASGYQGALSPETLTIKGTITAASYTLTAGIDTIAAGSGNHTIVAAANTLSQGDSINAGTPGTNTLQLLGGGTFNLALPTTLSNIQTITAQEGQGATAQTITLRAGLNAAVKVAPDTAGDASPTITIIGASNTDVISLGSGNDVVTMGAGETVNGGGGNNTFYATSATIRSTINGGTGTNILVVTGGGTVNMGGVITGISKVSLASPTIFAANTTANLTIVGSTAGGDTITLGAASQSVVSGGTKELIKATAANAGASVSGVGSNSTLEITSAGSVTLNPATNVATVKLDAASMLGLNGMAFMTAIAATSGSTIIAGGTNQTLTSTAGAATLFGYAGGGDTFRGSAAGLNGDTIQGLVASDSIDITNLAFAHAVLSVAASGGNTVVTATSGGTSTVFTLAGDYSASGFMLASDGVTGTVITHT